MCVWVAVHLHHDQDRILHSLRNTNVEKTQHMFVTTERQNADLQLEELTGLSGQLSWEESPLNIVSSTVHRYLQTIYSQCMSLQQMQKMVWDARIQTPRNLESNSKRNDAELRGERTSSVQRIQSSIHSNVEPETAELLLRTVHAVDQLSIYGVVVQCAESQSQIFACDLISYLTEHETRGTSARDSSTQNRNDMIEHLPETARLVTVCEDAGCVRTHSKAQYFMTGPGLDEFDNADVHRECIHTSSTSS